MLYLLCRKMLNTSGEPCSNKPKTVGLARLGSLELAWDRFFKGLDEPLSLTGGQLDKALDNTSGSGRSCQAQMASFT